MPDFIFITQSTPVGFGGEPLIISQPDMGGITVHYARVRSNEELQTLLSGATFAELGEGAIVEHGDIAPPDGTPLPEFELGYAAIASFEEAADIARAARTNPNGILAARGFTADTPIYFLTKGHQAEKLD